MKPIVLIIILIGIVGFGSFFVYVDNFVLMNKLSTNNVMTLEEYLEKVSNAKNLEELDKIITAAKDSEKIHDSCALYFEENIKTLESLEKIEDKELTMDENRQYLIESICLDTIENWKHMVSDEFSSHLETD